ncbi:MAG: hypothetical protein P8Y36_01350 [Alphaproteobacteria bacterium]
MRIVKFDDTQQVTFDDFQNLAADPREAMDVVVGEAIEQDAKYSGGAVTRTATTKITVATPLYLFKQGRVYSREDANGVEVDLLAHLPSSGNKRIVAVVLQGQEVSDETEERDFEIDGTTFPPVVEAQPKATRLYRRCEVSLVVGTAAPTPVKPAVDSALLPVAYVTLTSTEVSAAIEQMEDNRIVPLGASVARLKGVETWRAQAEPAIDGLRSDLANLQGAASAKESRHLTRYLLEQTARLNAAVGISPNVAFSQGDFFLDSSDSDTTHIDYLARVEEGLRFDHANYDEMALALKVPSDTRFVVHADGLLLPKYDDVTLISVKGRDSEVALSNAGAQSVDYRKRTVSKTRIRWGNSMTVCSNSIWFRTGRYDVSQNVFYKDGETWQVVAGDPTINHTTIRLTKFWVDTYEEVYWDRIVSTASYVGNVGAETFLVPRSAWVRKLRLGFSRVDTGGDVRVLITKTTASGAPDPQNVLTEATIAQGDLKTYPELSEVTLPPVLLEAGQRYAFVLITAGNHWLALVENNKYAQGSFFTSTDGAWFQGDISRDACFEVVGCAFEAPRLAIDLDNWNLDGGITDIDLLLRQIAPDPAITNITFEVRIGGVWVPLEEVASGNHPLYGQPASVDARMILQGTTELMPGIHVATSFVTLSRPRTGFTHISGERATGVNVDEVEIVALLEHYDEAAHDCAATLLVGAGFDTEETADAVSDQVLPDGTVKRTWTFTGLTPTQEYKRKFTGATTSALSVFHVAEVTDAAYPA